MSEPGLTTIKRLFAVGGDCCAFPGCMIPLVDGESVRVQICHIKGKGEGKGKKPGARYDSGQSDEERHGFNNLILMCANHHGVIDSDEETYTVDVLLEYKRKHETKSLNNKSIPNDEALDELRGVKCIGVRSFERGAENISDTTDVHLDLVPHFDGRNLRDSVDWHEHVYAQLEGFLKSELSEDRPYHIHLPAHSCIGFGAGYCLDSKTGVNAIPVQYTAAGKIAWEPDSAESVEHPLWAIEDIAIGSQGEDIAIALNVTRQIEQHVREHIDASLPSVHRLISCNILPEPSPRALRDGSHALHAAEEIVDLMQRSRSTRERKGVLHIFSSAPIGFLFFLGQMGRGFGKCVLYEHDFEGDGSYRPSLCLPR